MVILKLDHFLLVLFKEAGGLRSFICHSNCHVQKFLCDLISTVACLWMLRDVLFCHFKIWIVLSELLRVHLDIVIKCQIQSFLWVDYSKLSKILVWSEIKLSMPVFGTSSFLFVTLTLSFFYKPRLWNLKEIFSLSVKGIKLFCCLTSDIFTLVFLFKDFSKWNADKRQYPLVILLALRAIYIEKDQVDWLYFLCFLSSFILALVAAGSLLICLSFCF